MKQNKTKKSYSKLILIYRILLNSQKQGLIYEDESSHRYIAHFENLENLFFFFHIFFMKKIFLFNLI